MWNSQKVNDGSPLAPVKTKPIFIYGCVVQASVGMATSCCSAKRKALGLCMLLLGGWDAVGLNDLQGLFQPEQSYDSVWLPAGGLCVGLQPARPRDSWRVCQGIPSRTQGRSTPSLTPSSVAHVDVPHKSTSIVDLCKDQQKCRDRRGLWGICIMC